MIFFLFGLLGEPSMVRDVLEAYGRKGGLAGEVVGRYG